MFKHFVRIVTFAIGTATALAGIPNTPVITSPPSDGAIVNGADVHMETGPFSDSGGDTHLNSDWQIWSVGAGSNTVWIENAATGTDKLHTHLGQGSFVNALAGQTQLAYDTDYRLKVRHRDNNNEVSAFAERFFHTAPATAILPLLLEDAASSPAPTWKDDSNANVILAASGPPSLFLESTNSETVLEFRGANGVTNLVFNPPALSTDKIMRLRVAGNVSLPASTIVFTDEHGIGHTIYLPAIATATDTNLTIAANGSTYYGDDFSNLARSTPVPWTVDQPGFQVDVVATGFQLPIGIAFVPNPGSQTNSPYFYVAELYGNIKVVTRDGTVSDYATHLLNFNPTGVFPGSGELGLCGILVDPNNGDVLAGLVNSTIPGNDSADKYPRIIRLHSTDGGLTASSTNSILDMTGEVQGPAHQISNLTIGPDGKLYAHNGDGMNTPNAQNLNSYQGKILRMNLDGTAPTDNPFYNAGNGINSADYVFVYGLRNPFGGDWRTQDGFHYEVENGPNTDRFARVVSGRNYLWDGSNTSMTNYAIYNWGGATAPVHVQFIQTSKFGGSGFPSDKFDHAFVTESGATYATGPQATGKRITEFVLDSSGSLVSGPIPVIHYNGSGKATAAGMAAGPDGLYFTDLYNDAATVATNRGADVLRIKFVGTADFISNIAGGKAPLVVQFTDTSNVPSPSAWLWDFGDGGTSTLQNPSHTYTVDGSYNVRLTVTGANGQSVIQKNAYIIVASVVNESGGIVVLEAEEAFTNITRNGQAWTLTTALTGFNGAGYMQALPDTGSNLSTTNNAPEMKYQANFTSAGTRTVWVRGSGVDANGDSVHVGVNGNLSTASNITFFTVNNTWAWTNRTTTGTATITVSAGTNTVNVWMREDGMRVDRILLTANANFKAILGNAFHKANADSESDLGTTMRSPFTGMTPDLSVTFYTGNQFQGTGGNPGNQLTTGSTLFYRNATNATWSSLPMTFFGTGTHTPNGVNNKYHSVTLPGGLFNSGDTVQYYFKIPYDDHLPTFVYGTDTSTSTTEFEATAQANPFSFTYAQSLTPTGPYLSVTNAATGAEARIYQNSGHIALANGSNIIAFAPPAVKTGSGPATIGAVLSSTPIAGGLQVRQTFGATSIVAQLTFPYEGVMRYEVVNWGAQIINETAITAASDVNEHFYGFGEKFNVFDQAGQKVRIMLSDKGGAKGDNTYLTVPWFISTKGYGFHLDATTESSFDLRASFGDRYVISNFVASSFSGYVTNALKFNVVYGPKLTDVLTRYTGYTGRTPVSPPWAYGAWMSSDIWRDGGEVRYVISKMRERGVAASVFVFDSPWEKSYNDFTWNTNQFSNAGTYENQQYLGFTTIGDMMTFLRTNGFKTILWMTPFINTSSVSDGGSLNQSTGQSPNYAEAATSNYFVRASVNGPPLSVGWWKGTGSPVDYTNPNARLWAQKQLSNLVAQSQSGGFNVIGGFKTDDGEAETYGAPYIPTTAVYSDGRTGIEMRNGYCVEYHRTIWNVLGTNGLVFGRSGFTGSHATPGVWAGDNEPNFTDANGMGSVVLAGQSAAMSGYAMWGHDICGYEENNLSSAPENLFMRWTQFGCFSPVMQMHRGVSAGLQYPWSFGANGLTNFQYYTQLRTALFPYIYSYAKESSTNGLPIFRPLVLLNQNDPTVYGIRHTWYFGNEFLMASMETENQTIRNVYLPAGKWYNFWNGTTYIGGQNVVVTNANQMQGPLFVREGAIIPMISTNVQTLCDSAYVNNPNIVTMDSSLQFLIYPTTNSSFTVYDGTSLQCTSNGTVITATLFSNPRPVLMRFFGPQPAGVERDGVRLPNVTDFTSASLGWRYDAPTGFVHVKFSHTGGSAQIRFAPDSVGDGNSDSWRLTQFGSATTTNASSCATCDPDGDGLSNAQEYLAGTNPNNAANFLRIAVVQLGGGNFVASFPTVLGMKYRIEKSDDLVTGPWTTVQDNIDGTGGFLPINDPGAASLPKRFYRVRLLP